MTVATTVSVYVPTPTFWPPATEPHTLYVRPDVFAGDVGVNRFTPDVPHIVVSVPHAVPGVVFGGNYSSYGRRSVPLVMRRVDPDALLPRPRPIVGAEPFVHAIVTAPVPVFAADALATTGSYVPKSTIVVEIVQFAFTCACTARLAVALPAACADDAAIAAETIAAARAVR